MQVWKMVFTQVLVAIMIFICALGHTVLSLRLDESGWAKLVVGRKLLIWKYKSKPGGKVRYCSAYNPYLCSLYPYRLALTISC